MQYKQQLVDFHRTNYSYKLWFCSQVNNNHQLGNCLLGRWSLGQGGGWRVPRREGEKSPEPSSGKESGMNNHYEGQEACRTCIAGAILIGSTSRTRFWILGKSWLAVDIFVSKSATPAQSPNLSLSLLRVKSPNGRLFFVAYFHSHLVSLSKSIFLQLFVLLLKWM